MAFVYSQEENTGIGKLVIDGEEVIGLVSISITARTSTDKCTPKAHIMYRRLDENGEMITGVIDHSK